MNIINLLNPELSDIKFKIINFKDGEQHFVFEDVIDHKETYCIRMRIVSANDLFILMQIGDILNRHLIEWQLEITYLMSMRMDRLMSFNESCSLQIVSNIINNLKPQVVNILEPHSSKTTTFINNSIYLPYTHVGNLLIDKNTIMCFPDHGAYQRYLRHYSNNPYMTFKKVRDLSTGKIKFIEQDITLTQIERDFQPESILLIDDLCDGGNTFISIAKQLRKIWSIPINIAVTHVVNEEGLQKLSNTFDKVVITNSYKNWDISQYNNITLYKIF